MTRWGTVVVLMLAVATAAAQTPVSRRAQAEAVVDALAAREFAKVTAQFNTVMAGALPGDSLGTGWNSAINQVGAFKRRVAAVEQTQGQYQIVVVSCEFEKGRLDITVTYDGDGRIAGLQVRPPVVAMPYAPPAYAIAGSFTEREVTVGTGEWALPGTLTLPAGAAPFAAVVLVHGSGPNDRDETVGPNKVFKDLALGLASRGVAVLRYDKRTLVHAGKLQALAGFTVKDESVDDALAAVQLLRKEPAIDPKRIFVLGHSLGGTIAPRIGAADAGVAGLIIMAGGVRSMDQAMADQYEYLARADGVVTPAEQQVIDEAKKTIAEVSRLTTADASSTRNIAGAPVAYWLDLRGFDPPAAARRLPQRMLVLQGARDYQVTTADFDHWKAGLAGKSNVTFHLYPDLNHLFLTGTGKSLPAEYALPGHIPLEVITDIATWIKA